MSATVNVCKTDRPMIILVFQQGGQGVKREWRLSTGERQYPEKVPKIGARSPLL